MKSILIMLLVVLGTVFSAEEPKPAEYSKLVMPVLSARCEAVKSDKDIPAAEHDKKVTAETDKVIADTSAAGDEAAVVLLDYWIGEGPGLNVCAELTARGKRILPLLKKYRDVEPPIENPCNYTKLDDDIRKAMFDQLKEAIEAGDKWK